MAACETILHSFADFPQRAPNRERSTEHFEAAGDIPPVVRAILAEEESADGLKEPDRRAAGG